MKGKTDSERPTSNFQSRTGRKDHGTRGPPTTGPRTTPKREVAPQGEVAAIKPQRREDRREETETERHASDIGTSEFERG
jgi:hypothetical protein